MRTSLKPKFLGMSLRHGDVPTGLAKFHAKGMALPDVDKSIIKHPLTKNKLDEFYFIN